jgi:hypothetical protein
MKQLLLALLFAVTVNLGNAQHAYITPEAELKTGYTSFVFQLNNTQLKTQLATAPLESAGAKSVGAIIELPMPDGHLETMTVVESPIMAAGLASKYPEIKSYKVFGNGISGRIGFTYKGFHGMLFTPEGTIYIDPIGNETETYHAYNRNDYTAFYKHTKGHVCLVDEEYEMSEPIDVPAAQRGSRSGDQLRTYRLALACTGEYAQFHGGNVPSVLSAMVVSMNRVNGVYERDFAITMELIADNDLLIFLNASTDPYTNNSGGAMLGENQTTVNSIIGSSNYDIGHVYSTGGGGIASLGSVCSFSNKARGVTGGGSPVGDPFDIDYVAHEIGHQFGGNHTQNNNCNRASSAAYEPGSASTIMGYAGICAPNLQNNSDDYFHAGTYDEVIAFSQFSSGNSCATISNTGNTKPVITEMPADGYTIPAGTPFVLRGAATDIDGDDLTYCWEQMDLGPSTHPDSPTGNAPAFRSWDPLNIGERTCPRLINVVLGSSVMGETYIDYSRGMNFRMTVRDNNLAGGGVSFDEFNFDVEGLAGPFEVLTPAAGESVEVGTTLIVNWDVAITNQAPINCQAVHILLCNNNGLEISDTLATAVPNSGSYAVQIPNSIGFNKRIRVEAADNIFFNINPGGFSIAEATAPADFQISLTAEPNFTTGSVELNWTDSFNNENFWIIERSIAGNNNFVFLDSVITNTVFYADGNVNMLGTEYVYRVYAANNVGNSNLSNEASYTGVGINDIETTNVKIFPNPTTDVLNIELGDNEQLERLVIRDVNSSIVRIIETNETRLNVNELSAGNYFLTVETNVSKSVVPFTVLAKN